MPDLTINGEPCSGLRLVVTGATGLLGWALVREALGRYQLWGLARHPEAAPLPCQTQAVDLVDEASVARILETIVPDVVIHLAALTSVDLCETDPATAATVNVEGTRNLLRALGRHTCRFILISTDSVFDGTRGDYAEDDPAVPLNVYGRTKLEAEEAVLVARSDALVVRTVFYGWNILPKESLAEWLLNRLRAGREVPGFLDVRFSPLLTNHLARLLLDLVPTSATGLLHVASSEGCSKYEFARRLATTFGFSPSRVVPTTSETIRLVAPRPKNITLAVERARAILGRPLPGVTEGLCEFLALESTMRGSGLAASADRGSTL